MEYSIQEHKHRFAAWAASRAAMTSKCCRFKVWQGKKIIEESGLRNIAQSIVFLPEPNDFDKQHHTWRQSVIEVAKQFNLDFTHGIAAKMINCYLKSIFVCAGYENNEKVKAIHPPIDRELLDALYKNNIGNEKLLWKYYRDIAWSKFSSEQYEKVIQAVKRITQPYGMWTIEQYWKGHQ